MNLHAKLLEREAAGRPITVGLIGAGKFGTMFLTQARRTPGLHVFRVADLYVCRAHNKLHSAGWEASPYAASSLAEALKTRTTHARATHARATHVGPDAQALLEHPG